MDSASDVDSTETTKKAAPKRGVGFPTLSLPAAVEIVHKAGQHGGDHSLTAFAGYAGHTTANSGPFKGKLAALKDWSLASTNSDRVILTELGKQFARVEAPLDDVPALRDAFFGCKIFKKFYDDTAKETSVKAELLARRAGLDYGVAAGSKDAFVASLIASAVAAGLADTEDKGKSVTFLAATDSTEPDVDVPGEAEHIVKEPANRSERRVPERRTPGEAARTAVVRQEWPIGAGEVILLVNSSRPIPADAFTLIGEAVTAAATLAAHLAAKDPQDSDGEPA